MQADSEKRLEGAWRDLYLAALFEADSCKLPERIAVAEYAMNLRDCELWYSGGDHNKEKHALIGAMRALEALRNIHQCPRPMLPTSSHRVEAALDILGEAGKSAGTAEPNVSVDRMITGGLFCK
jgi:hypothetical protein